MDGRGLCHRLGFVPHQLSTPPTLGRHWHHAACSTRHRPRTTRRRGCIPVFPNGSNGLDRAHRSARITPCLGFWPIPVEQHSPQACTLFLPFVTPPVVAAVGFLALISPGGLYNLGFDLRGETGFIGWLQRHGVVASGHFIALVGAHVWFNLSLMIRFVEPVVAQLDSTWEEQLALLPSGQTRRERIQHLWLPVLGPATLVAATYTFFFSFTSFALVKWLAPSSNTLESMLGEMGGTAGIAGYQVETSLAVLSIATFQMLLMLVMLILAGRFERQHSQVLSMHHEAMNRERNGTASRGWRWFVNGILVLLLAPLATVVLASFRVRTIGNQGVSSAWTLEGWKRAWNGDFSTVPLLDALTNSLSYAVVSLFVALPVGYAVASCLVTLRQRGHQRAAGILDSLCMLPLSMSAVMVGLGMVAGILQWFPEMFTFPYLPAVPHIMLVLPFVIRLMVPAIERIDPIFAEQASLLPMGKLSFWWHSRGSFLVVPATMAGSLCLAFSMGEFGARSLLFVLVRGIPVHFGRPSGLTTQVRPVCIPNRHGVGDDIDVGHAVGAFH